MTVLKKKVLRESGLTAIELIIALALLGVVLLIGYNVYFFAAESFDRGETLAEVQRNMRNATAYITEELRPAREAELKDGPEPVNSGENYIYGQDGSLIHRFYNEDTTDEEEHYILKKIPGAVNYNFEINKSTADAVGGKDLETVVDFIITAPEIGYRVKTSVDILNISGELADFTGTGTPTAIFFKK